MHRIWKKGWIVLKRLLTFRWTGSDFLVYLNLLSIFLQNKQNNHHIMHFWPYFQLFQSGPSNSLPTRGLNLTLKKSFFHKEHTCKPAWSIWVIFSTSKSWSSAETLRKADETIDKSPRSSLTAAVMRLAFESTSTVCVYGLYFTPNGRWIFSAYALCREKIAFSS